MIRPAPCAMQASRFDSRKSDVRHQKSEIGWRFRLKSIGQAGFDAAARDWSPHHLQTEFALMRDFSSMSVSHKKMEPSVTVSMTNRRTANFLIVRQAKNPDMHMVERCSSREYPSTSRTCFARLILSHRISYPSRHADCVPGWSRDALW